MDEMVVAKKHEKSKRLAFIKHTALETGTAASVSVDRITGDVWLEDRNGKRIKFRRTGIGMGRIRKNGKLKPLMVMPPNTRTPAVVSVSMEDFKSSFAIDATQITEFPELRFAIAVLEYEHFVDGMTDEWRIHNAVIFDVACPSRNAELIGWKLLSEEILSLGKRRENDQFLFVSDYDHNDIQQRANDRIGELLPSWKLPDGFFVAYASEESPCDSLGQLGISRADTLGRRYKADHLDATLVRFEPGLPTDNFDRVCVWRFDRDQKAWLAGPRRR